jgi:hypothetical protein
LIQTVTAENPLLPGSFLTLIDDIFQPMSFISDAGRSLRQSVEGRHIKRVSNTQVDPEDVFRLVLGVLWISAIQSVIDSLNLKVC